MLVIFDLDWKKCDINDQVAAANNEINGLAGEKGVGHFISFNLASLGAGERIMALRYDKEPDRNIIDELRHHHWHLAKGLEENSSFRAYRDVAEMLSGMKSRDYRLATVFTGAADVAAEALKRARIIDYFEESIYGYNSTLGNNLSAVYRHAINMEAARPSDTIIVSDNPETISDVRFLRPKATIGYVDPHRETGETSIKLRDMEAAKANYTMVGGYSVPWFCDLIRGRGFSKSL